MSAATTGSPNPFHISATTIHLSGPTRYVRVSVKANAAALSGPTANAFPASSLTGTASNAVNGVGASGVLSSLAFTPVINTIKNPGSTSVDLVWSLAAPAVRVRSGTYTLTVTWKIESL